MKRISTAAFDKKFDEGKEEILDYCDPKSLTKPGLAIKRVNVDFPQWMVDRLDGEAARLGIARQAAIKTLLAGLLLRRGKPRAHTANRSALSKKR